MKLLSAHCRRDSVQGQDGGGAAIPIGAAVEQLGPGAASIVRLLPLVGERALPDGGHTVGRICPGDHRLGQRLSRDHRCGGKRGENRERRGVARGVWTHPADHAAKLVAVHDRCRSIHGEGRGRGAGIDAAVVQVRPTASAWEALPPIGQRSRPGRLHAEGGVVPGKHGLTRRLARDPRRHRTGCRNRPDQHARRIAHRSAARRHCHDRANLGQGIAGVRGESGHIKRRARRRHAKRHVCKRRGHVPPEHDDRVGDHCAVKSGAAGALDERSRRGGGSGVRSLEDMEKAHVGRMRSILDDYAVGRRLQVGDGGYARRGERT